MSSNSAQQRRVLALLGAIVADAAATSTHWVYDVVSGRHWQLHRSARNSVRQFLQDRIAEVAKEHNSGDVAFVPPSPTGAYHEGIPAYFAHKTKEHGDVRQLRCKLSLTTPSHSSLCLQHTYYSEIGLALARSLVAKGALDIQDFQQKLLDAFGFGKWHSSVWAKLHPRRVLPLQVEATLDTSLAC